MPRAASGTLPRAIRRAAPGLLLAVMLALSLRAFPAHGAPATVTPLPAPAIAPTEGVAYSGSAGSFTDTDLSCSTDPLTATIDWGDGTLDTGTVDKSNCPTVTVTGLHTYADEGTFTVTTTLNGGSNAATVMATANVADADTLTVSSTTPVVGTVNTLVTTTGLATFATGNPNNVAGDFTATIAWGDGTSSAGTITLGGTVLTVDGTHTYASGGSFSISVSVQDDAPGTGAATAGPIAATIAFLAGTSPSVTTLALNPPTPVAGQPLTYTATVSGSSPGTTAPCVPLAGDSVLFSVNGSVVGAAPLVLVGAQLQAKLTQTLTANGTATFSAQYLPSIGTNCQTGFSAAASLGVVSPQSFAQHNSYNPAPSQPAPYSGAGFDPRCAFGCPPNGLP
jgi:hypothetical protein